MSKKITEKWYVHVMRRGEDYNHIETEYQEMEARVQTKSMEEK